LTETENKKWHALYVASRQEKKVNQSLLEKGVEAYVPLLKTMRQWSDRKKMVELPLLNGYVFVRISNQETDRVLQTKGVVSFVRSEKKIAIIRDSEIARLKQLIELGYQMEAGTAHHTYKENDKIKITAGPLKNIEGYVIEDKAGRSIDILLESIGKVVRVKLPREIIVEV
jgi:transcription antitermination factor NusG